MPTLFLHSGFRTGSTWFWNRFRMAAGTYAYYEPFHEQLNTLTPQEVADSIANIWPSGHPPLDRPYLHEYAPLLDAHGGVRFFFRRLTHDFYYQNHAHAGTARYVDGLVDYARAQGKVPVLGFCRSFGRLIWFSRHYPSAIHIATWRPPRDQWVSCHRLTSEFLNPYFELRYFLIAAHGRRHPEFGSWFDGLTLPESSADTTPLLALYMNNDGVAERFRVFLRVFLLDMLIALEHASLMVDLDRMTADTAYRDQTAAVLRQLCGLPDLDFSDCALPGHDFPDDADYPALMDEGRALLAGLAGTPLGARFPHALPELIRRLERP